MTKYITKTWFDGEKVVTQEIPESEIYKQEQEPVAWVYEWDGRKHLTFTDQRFVEQAHPHFNKSTPLYAAPRQWVGLTEEELDAIYAANGGTRTRRQIARAIEAKLKEKNT